MPNEPTWDEIQKWRERLDDREFQQALMRFQSYVYQIFEDLRKQTGLQLIRAIVPRDEVKTIESVTEKIARKRNEQGVGDRPYDFDDLRDLVGIKILCPYQRDSDQVADYLFLQNNRTLRITESTRQQGWSEHPTGYKGYNFTVYPILGAPAQWMNLYCEVQIKTMLQEAWDAKTHDLMYKRTVAVPLRLQEYFSGLASLLNQAEVFANQFRQEIEDLSSEAAAHKDSAAKALFFGLFGARTALQRLSVRYPVPNIETPRDLSVDEVRQINEALRAETASRQLTREHCNLAAFLALSHRDPGQAAMALQLCNDYAILSSNRRCETEILRGAVYWSLSRFARSVEFCEHAFESCNDLPEPEAVWVKADFCYYVTDATVFGTYVAPDTLNRVRTTTEALVAITDISPNTIDTIGFVKIALGGTAEEVHDGLRWIERARDGARRLGDTTLIEVAEAFYLRHRRLAQKKLDQFGQSL